MAALRIGMLALLFPSAIQASEPPKRKNISPEKFNSGDLRFTCLRDTDSLGRYSRTFGIHYIGKIREVTFNHQGPVDALSDGWLRAPITSVVQYFENGRPRWKIAGAGTYNKRQYEFTATLKDIEGKKLVADFQIGSRNVAMSGKACWNVPPNPLGHVSRSVWGRK